MAQTTLRDYLQSTEDAIGSGRIDEAFTHCEHMLTHFPESLEAQRLLGEVYLAQGQLADAQQTFDWVLTNDPENVIAYCDRALISERMADYETALDCYQQAYELSRGNGQIRQEFNILSAKIGQQGFIFSRAGLARLYMRGDLLPQAIQEWEAVLAVNPDRLDARTGLLETYWRDGLYDQVEQIARDILNDVPACLKALLLLAHVTFAQNVTASQELLQRAEALDPELTMAAELFSDFLAAQPHDPFLNLLQKGPASFTHIANGHQTSAIHPASSTQSVGSPSLTNGNNGSHSTSEFSDSLMRWSSLDNIIEPQQDHQIVQDDALLATWSGNQQSDNNSRNVPAEQHLSLQESDIPVFDNWPPLEMQPAQQVANVDEVLPDEPSGSEQSSWPLVAAEASQVAPKDEDIAQWSDAHTLTPANATPTWEGAPVEETIPSPPAWLDMLTRGEQRWQPNEPTSTLAPTSPAETEAPAVEPSAQPVYQEEKQPTGSLLPSHEQHSAMPVAPQQDDEPDFSFGPEWLKSLGATSISMSGIVDTADSDDALPSAATETIAPAQPITPVIPAPSMVDEHFSMPLEETVLPPIESEPVARQSASYVEPATPFFGWAPVQPEWEEQTLLINAEQPAPPVAQPSMTVDEPDNTPAPAIAQAAEVSPVIAPVQKPSVEAWLAQAAEKLSHPDQNLLVTLEELEKDLRSQGFTQLEPGSLATIAQEPTLSSALAQLGNFEQQALQSQAPIVSQAAKPAVPDQSIQTPILPLAPPVVPTTPLWAATPEPVAQQNPPIAPLANMAPMSALPSHLDMLSSLTSQARPKVPSSPLPADEPIVPAPAQSAQPIAQVSQSVPAIPPVLPKPATPPPTGLDAMLDMELETTMKRPSVRLQPIQPQRQGTGRGNSGERTTSNKPSAGGDLTYKERLLKGYQYQLAGSYDNAMQEYRIIIRNAPELLDEVVSNMRALLKLAPKYSAGFRVLGDAYMRQGEYLQAMEAYNKALTMAKKAKS
jgi:tetratricopeptide (TPR) repeat protein